MHVLFGIHLDGGGWPEFSEGTEALIGDVFLGPSGLIGLLEINLGLGGKEVPEALRIRQYMIRMQSLPLSSRFYSDSFSSDAWASARTLLGWRDELIFHGWSPAIPQQPERLSALAEIESLDAKPLAPGLADRFRSVLDKLREHPSLPLRTVRLQEPRRLLPGPWQQLLTALESCGVTITGNTAEQGRPEEIVVLESEHTWPLAQAVASWLRHAPDADGAALLCQQETTQLDQALHSQGLPATGQGMISAHLGILQLLPLVLENLWKPVRIDRLMELLSVPLSPVPSFAARRLARALAKTPGLEGHEWNDALAEIAAKKAGYLLRDGKMSDEAAGREGEEFAQEIDRWLRVDRIAVENEAPCPLVIKAIHRLQNHLARLKDRHPMAVVAMGHCRDLRMILSDMRTVGKPLLDRIVDDVIGPGRSADNLREASPWGVVGNPSQLTGPVHTLIWWGFVDPSSPAGHVWSEAERQWLCDRGVYLDPPSLTRGRERHHWLASLARCKRLLLCRPLELNGEPVAMHPLWAEIEADPLLAQRCTHVQAMDLYTSEAPELLGTPMGFVPASPIREGDTTAWKTLDASNLQRPDKLSPTSLGNLFGCSFKWLLEHLGVAASAVMGFPRESAMIGTLAHQVLEDVFSVGQIPAPDDAARKAADSYAARVPEMGADLLLPENRAEYEDICQRIADAARDLAQRFAVAGFDRVVCEERLETKLDGIAVHGRADAIAYKGKTPHIIDFKYSYGITFYKKKLQEGKDVQLLTYARMLGDQPSPVAYYLIPLREMVTIFPEFGSETVEASTPLSDGWTRVRKTYGARMSELKKGLVLAAGVLDEAGQKALAEEREQTGEIHLAPPCTFCDFASLCGRHGGGTNDA